MPGGSVERSGACHRVMRLVAGSAPAGPAKSTSLRARPSIETAASFERLAPPVRMLPGGDHRPGTDQRALAFPRDLPQERLGRIVSGEPQQGRPLARQQRAADRPDEDLARRSRLPVAALDQRAALAERRPGEVDRHRLVGLRGMVQADQRAVAQVQRVRHRDGHRPDRPAIDRRVDAAKHAVLQPHLAAGQRRLGRRAVDRVNPTDGVRRRPRRAKRAAAKLDPGRLQPNDRRRAVRRIVGVVPREIDVLEPHVGRGDDQPGARDHEHRPFARAAVNALARLDREHVDGQRPARAEDQVLGVIPRDRSSRRARPAEVPSPGCPWHGRPRRAASNGLRVACGDGGRAGSRPRRRGPIRRRGRFRRSRARQPSARNRPGHRRRGRDARDRHGKPQRTSPRGGHLGDGRQRHAPTCGAVGALGQAPAENRAAASRRRAQHRGQVFHRLAPPLGLALEA